MNSQRGESSRTLYTGAAGMPTLAANRSLRPNESLNMSTYGIKRAYQHNAEIHPFAVNLCVSSFLLTLRTGLVAICAPEGGEGGCCLYPTKHIRLADTGYGNAALGGTRPGPEQQCRRSLHLIN